MIEKALKNLRVYHNIKQKDLAKKLDVSPSHLCEIEAGRKPVSYELMQKYSSVFDVPVSSITIFAEIADSSEKNRLASALAGKALSILEWMDNVTRYEESEVK